MANVGTDALTRPSATCSEKPARTVSELNPARARLGLAGEAQTGKREASLLISWSGWFHKCKL